MSTSLRGWSRRVLLAGLPAILAAGLLVPSSLHAAATTNLTGDVSGVELCPQVICGAALFIGRFDGALDGTAGDGRWWVLVNHEALPTATGASTAITGGRWGMMVGDQPLRGLVSSGSITNNGDGTFTVTPYLDVVGGNEGTLSLSILLDHANGWPPTVLGKVAAGTVEIPAITWAPISQATSQPWS